jgi:hypothetical protein
MAQQPLTGRGLSQTILQPTDILGEAQLRQQQEQMLAARQQAAQKPKKPFEIKAPDLGHYKIKWLICTLNGREKMLIK